MKVEELLKEDNIPAVRDLPPIDKTELANVIKQVRNSNEYKTIIDKYFKEITSPIQEKNGTLAFILKNAVGEYYIYSNGQLRTSSSDRLTKLPSPTPNKDLYTRYINCVIELENKAIKRLKKPIDELKIIGQSISSLSELELPDECRAITIKNTNIRNLIALPKQINSFIRIENNKQLSSLEGISEYNGAILILNNPKIDNLHNIHKLIKSMTRDFYFDDEIKLSVLGLILIPGIREIISYGDKTADVAKILSKHIKSKDILECQEELITNGYRDYAKL
jgi:hypothetical protein